MTNSGYFDALPPGYNLFEYRIDSVLGQGGFGITYKAQDTNLDKAVALKEYLPEHFARRVGSDLIRPKPGSEEDFRWGLERFEREAQVLAQFDHPNIVPVLRRFTANGTVYMVMGYEEGESLDRILDNTDRLAESELEEILYPLLDGLHQLHEGGILHRDIKPENIFIRLRDGSPVLLDFGAARAAIGARGKTVTRIITPNYAPYEQYYSEGKLGPWTDIYALASVIYEGITGNPPPEAPSRIAQDKMLRATDAGYGLYRADFLAAIDWALAFAPEDRPQSVTELRAALPSPLDAALATATDMASIVAAPRVATERLAKAAADATHRRTSGTNHGIRRPDGSAARPTHEGHPAAPAAAGRRRSGHWAAAAAILLMLGGIGTAAVFLAEAPNIGATGGQAGAGAGSGPVATAPIPSGAGAGNTGGSTEPGSGAGQGDNQDNGGDNSNPVAQDGPGTQDGNGQDGNGQNGNGEDGSGTANGETGDSNGEQADSTDPDDAGDPAAEGADAQAAQERLLAVLRKRYLEKLKRERERRVLATVLRNRRLSTILPGRRTLTLLTFHGGGKLGGSLRAVTLTEGESNEEIAERGSWAADGNRLCLRLSRWNSGRLACFRVRWRGKDQATKRPRVPLIADGRTGSFKGTLVRR